MSSPLLLGNALLNEGPEGLFPRMGFRALDIHVFAETGSLDLGRVEWLLVSAQGNTSQA